MRHALPWLSLCAAVTLFACSSVTGPEAPPPGALVVRSGTFFGACIGYCSSELTVSGPNATLVVTGSNTGKFPPKVAQGMVSTEEMNGLENAVSFETFAKLDSVIGCPDCRDQGSEWVELERDGRRMRVVFEFGETIPEIDDLVERVRSIRNRLVD